MSASRAVSSAPPCPEAQHWRSAALTITERFTRTSDTSLRYLVTVDDPMTWTAPFTMQFTLDRDDTYGMFEHACHEGNQRCRTS